MCLLQEDAIAGHNGFVEREPRLGTVPVRELPNGMVVRPSRTRGREAVEDCSFRLFQVRQPEYGFGRALAFRLCHAAILWKLAVRLATRWGVCRSLSA